MARLTPNAPLVPNAEPGVRLHADLSALNVTQLIADWRGGHARGCHRPPPYRRCGARWRDGFTLTPQGVAADIRTNNGMASREIDERRSHPWAMPLPLGRL
jgi:hypothetical protein